MQNTWKDEFEYQDFYKTRYKFMINLLKLNMINSIMDLGSGPEFLREYIPASVDYYPVDYLKKTNNTIIKDFNRGEFLNKKVDVMIMAGLLGYIYNLNQFIKDSARNTDCIIASYMFPSLYPAELGQTIHVNCLSQKQLFEIFKRHGFKIIMTPFFNKDFTVFIATRRKVNFLKYDLIFKYNLLSPFKTFYQENKKLLNNLFSIENENSEKCCHKIITILWLKIKFKIRKYK